MILADNTFNFVHKSRKQCASLSLGIILAWLLFTQTSSRVYKSVIAFQPNLASFARLNYFVPPGFEENKAFTMFSTMKTRSTINTGNTTKYELPGEKGRLAKISY